MDRIARQFPALKNGRAHEVQGPGALSFALAMAAGKRGPVMVIDAARNREHLHPSGAGGFIEISRLLLAYGRSHNDILWVAEEALRSGCVPVVIARIGKEIDLTAGRRLQLAARAGNALGLMIISEGAGSHAAETRWHCRPVPSSEPDSDSTHFEWSCIKNKTGTCATWMVRWNEAAHHIDLFSKTGNGPLLAAQAG